MFRSAVGIIPYLSLVPYSLVSSLQIYIIYKWPLPSLLKCTFLLLSLAAGTAALKKKNLKI